MRAVLDQGRVTGIHATFSQLHLYNHLFLGPSSNVFLLLGNTLGNELDEVATLRDIRDGMNKGDILVTEVQLIEQEPTSSEELTAKIQAAKYFYAGPFTALGCRLDHIELFAEQDGEEASARSIDAVTYRIFCRFKETHEIQHPLFDMDMRLRIRDAKMCVYIVRKYRETTLSQVFERAGFEVLGQISTNPSGPRDFRFHYLTARKG